ncbi:MAG: dihydrolipoamide acetyltransferase family protein [Dehalococcoidia bacterium]
MISEVTMPSMGADMTEGTIVKWLKSEGDEVKRGEKLAEIETDKTVVEMEAYSDGLLRKIVVAEGEKVPVGELIAYIGGADDEVPGGDGADAQQGEAPAEEAEETEEEAPEAEASAEEGEEETEEAEPEAEEKAPEPEPAPQAARPAVAAPATGGGDRVKASPMARRLAEEKGIDIAQVPGTGPGGRVTRDDVLGFKPSPAFASVAPQRASVELDGSDINLTTMRQAIARVTVRSMTEAPHFYVTSAIDMTQLMQFRKNLNEALSESGVRVSVNDMILKACVNALIKYPKFNSFFDGDKLKGHSDINIGIAIALEQGLIVPALMKAQGKSLVEISQAAKDLGNRARGKGGSLSQSELTAGTFATSNLGMFDVDTFSAIIVPPQAAILATGTVTKTPVVKDDEIVVAEIMKATVSTDHRVADGAEAAVFLQEVKKNLENPAYLIV